MNKNTKHLIGEVIGILGTMAVGVGFACALFYAAGWWTL